MSKHQKPFLSIIAGSMLIALTVACSGNSDKSENTDNTQSAQTSTDTAVMGLQGDTTTNSVDGPISAPTDTATGQTLPEANMKVREPK